MPTRLFVTPPTIMAKYLALVGGMKYFTEFDEVPLLNCTVNWPVPENTSVHVSPSLEVRIA